MLLLPLLLYLQGWTVTTRFLTINAALFVLYNTFILMTYIAVFPAEMSVRPIPIFATTPIFRWSLLCPWHWRFVISGRRPGLGAAVRQPLWRLVLPFGAGRFCEAAALDLAMPQPLVWDLAKKLAPYLQDGDRLALLLPGTMIASPR